MLNRLFFVFIVLLCLGSCSKKHSDSGGPVYFITVNDTAGVHDTAFTSRNNGYSYYDSSIAPVTSMFIPNAFSPNGDGVNDYYISYGMNFTNFSLIIKNLSGAKIYQTTDANRPWDGRDSSGAVMPEGYYVANISFVNSKHITYLYVLYINLYHFVHPGCISRNAMDCKFGDMIDPRYGFIYPTTESFCP